MYRRNLVWVVVVFAGGAALPGRVQAEDWSRFRGPNGSGVGRGTIPVKWSDTDYNWRVTIPGVGHSSPVIWGDKIFLGSGDEESAERIVACFSSAGKEIWQRRFQASSHRKHKLNSYGSATPAVDADHVYVLFQSKASSPLIAFDHDGSSRHG